jgi:hypothetical protein
MVGKERGVMPRSKTNFEQIPVAVVKRIATEDVTELTIADLSEITEYNPQYPRWRALLQQALLEFDKEKLQARVAEVETAIFQRQQEIVQTADGRAELQAMDDAMATLRILKRESLGFPDRKE